MRGTYFRTFCIMHELDGQEHNPSCDIEIDPRGRIRAICRSKHCSRDEIIKALRKRGMVPRPRIIASYTYEDEHGEELSLHHRWEPKNFTYEANGSRGKDCMKGVRRVLFGLPELLAAPADAWVCPGEGERDALTLRGLGYVGTSGSGGAGKMTAEEAAPLKGRRVAVFPDADEPGAKHGRLVARLALEAGASEVRIVATPDGCKDVTEFVEAGGTREQLDELIDAAPAVTAADVADAEATGDYAAQKAALEKRFCIIESQGLAIYDAKIGQAISKDVFYNQGAGHWSYNDKAGSTAVRWLKDPEQLTYQDLVLTPGPAPAGCLNLFRGFAVEPVEGDTSWWNGAKDALLPYVIADQDICTEIERALLWGFAHPDKWKILVWPIIIGANGIGKDLIGQFICNRSGLSTHRRSQTSRS